MKIGVNLKIDVTKIDKNLLFKGEKGTYLDAVVFVDIDDKDQYDNNGMITQDAGKDQKGNILGNCRVFWRDSQQPPPPVARPSAPQNMDSFDENEIPFANPYKGIENLV